MIFNYEIKSDENHKQIYELIPHDAFVEIKKIHYSFGVSLGWTRHSCNILHGKILWGEYDLVLIQEVREYFDKIMENKAFW